MDMIKKLRNSAWPYICSSVCLQASITFQYNDKNSFFVRTSNRQASLGLSDEVKEVWKNPKEFP